MLVIKNVAQAQGGIENLARWTKLTPQTLTYLLSVKQPLQLDKVLDDSLRIKKHSPLKIRDSLGLQDVRAIRLEGNCVAITSRKLATPEEWYQDLQVMNTVHEQNRGVSEEQVYADPIYRYLGK